MKWGRGIKLRESNMKTEQLTACNTCKYFRAKMEWLSPRDIEPFQYCEHEKNITKQTVFDNELGEYKTYTTHEARSPRDINDTGHCEWYEEETQERLRVKSEIQKLQTSRSMLGYTLCRTKKDEKKRNEKQAALDIEITALCSSLLPATGK